MKVALVNPPWRFENSIYFGCRAPHLPLELGYTKALLEQADNVVLILDGHLSGQSCEALADEVAAFRPEMTVVTTAPSYLFWRCAQPELRMPREFLLALAGRGGTTVAVGPHSSATPATVLRKLGADVAVMGECEEIVARLAETRTFADVPSVAYRAGGDARINGIPHAAKFTDPAAAALAKRSGFTRHLHHHHRFDREPMAGCRSGGLARVSVIHALLRKDDFRDRYRRRELGPAAR